MMKRLIKYTRLFFYSTLVILSASCSKEEGATVTGNAKISFTNAATEAPALDVYIDNEKVTATPIAFGSTDPYQAINAGLRFMNISPDGSKRLVSGNVPFAADSSYSVFAYDTINASGTLKALLLTDKLATPVSGKAHMRYLQLSPDTGKVNIQLINSIDTIRIGDKIYIGANTITDVTLQNFAVVNAGTYTIHVRKTAADPVIYSTTVTLSEGKIYTLYARGKKANGSTPQGFNISSILHN